MKSSSPGRLSQVAGWLKFSRMAISTLPPPSQWRLWLGIAGAWLVPRQFIFYVLLSGLLDLMSCSSQKLWWFLCVTGILFSVWVSLLGRSFLLLVIKEVSLWHGRRVSLWNLFVLIKITSPAWWFLILRSVLGLFLVFMLLTLYITEMFFGPLFLNWVTLWVGLLGDFNGIMSSTDKAGGRNFGLPSHFLFSWFCSLKCLHWFGICWE
jgi:hypothetical protein